jgi:mono/diheme cytochrome c family protein
MSGKQKGLMLLFSAFVGIGFLGGLTGVVASAPQNIPESDREPALVYNTGLQPADQAKTTDSNAKPEDTNDQPTEAQTVSLDTSVFSNNGCIQCHAIPGLNVNGGSTGPDLTFAINNVPNKYGKSLTEFLQQPEGIMAEVLPTKNVTDEEKEQIVELLTKAAEQASNQTSDQAINQDATDKA